MVMVLSVILSLFASFMVGAIALSYWIAYRMQRTHSVLSFAIFFTTVFISSTCGFWVLLNMEHTGFYRVVPGEFFRLVIFLAASIYLFMTTWNTKIKK